MHDHARTLLGHAVIESMFPLRRRGRVLVLAEGFRGVIPKDGLVETSQGTMPYSGPEFVDGADRKSRVAVIVPQGRESDDLPIGESIAFSERD